MTPLEYCRGIRIARARELLISGDTPQKAVAESLGYKDVASFARVFRKTTGTTPGNYRKRFAIHPGGHEPKPNRVQGRAERHISENVSGAESLLKHLRFDVAVSK